MSELYPAVTPYDAGSLDVGDGHQLYWETVGNPEGLPAVFLHGGPGSGRSEDHRRYFDPQGYRVVLFDQRGCGRSTPLAVDATADLSTNTTQHLMTDIEAVREHLDVNRWVVAGVSWGVTLGLAYAQQHPERVRAMVLAAVTNGSRLETDWITRDMGRVFPREWDRFIAQLPREDRDGDPSLGYAKLLADPDPAVQQRAAYEWCRWEDTHMSLGPDWEPWLQREPEEFQQVFARLVTHYWSNGSFLETGQIIDGMSALAGILAVLIHGTYDVSGPLDTAWHLHNAWPGSRLVVLDDAGHGGGSFGAEMVRALDGFATTLAP